MLPNKNLTQNKKDSHYQKMYTVGKIDSSDVFFYKLRRREEGFSEIEFFQFANEDELKLAKAQGRIYDPQNRHSWMANLHWVLGVIHHQRKIKINSQVITQNIWRKDFIPAKGQETKQGEFCAFTKEIAAVLKIGYQIEMVDGFLILTRKNDEESRLNLNSLGIDEINPTKDEVVTGINKIVEFILNEIKKNFEDLYLYVEYFQQKNGDCLALANLYTKCMDFDLELEEKNFRSSLELLTQLAENCSIYENATGKLKDFKQLKLEYETENKKIAGIGSSNFNEVKL